GCAHLASPAGCSCGCAIRPNAEQTIGIRRERCLTRRNRQLRYAYVTSTEQNAHPATGQSYASTSVEHTPSGLVAVFRQPQLVDFDLGIFGELDERARDQCQVDCGAIRCAHGAATMNFALGRDWLELISFRVSENDITGYEKHCGYCRASDSFRAPG